MKPFSSAVLYKKVYNRMTTGHVKWSINGEQNANILREREMTCSWVVFVPTMNYSAAFEDRAEGAAVQYMHTLFFGSMHYP